jgi:hypothetical protein
MQAQQLPATSLTTPAHPSQISRAVAAEITTITRAAERGPFTAAALRDLKFKAHDRKNSRGEIIKGNGTGPAGVWIQIGAKVLIDLGALDRWIESHRLGVST